MTVFLHGTSLPSPHAAKLGMLGPAGAAVRSCEMLDVFWFSVHFERWAATCMRSPAYVYGGGWCAATEAAAGVWCV